MAAHTKPAHRNLHHPFPEKETLRHWFVWLLLVLAMFYGMHQYFEYRERELDRRIEQMRTDLLSQSKKTDIHSIYHH